MNKQPEANKPLGLRLWEYQWERIPVLLIAVIAALNVGVVYSFSDQKLVPGFFAAVMIIVLYMVQIRASDEKKDFEHDNKFHKDRPVQRGLVTLQELATVNRVVIILQLLIYASFISLPILLVGLASQSYAFLTRKEFFIREWLRPHFHLYNLLHYVQLVILQFGVIVIVQPEGISKVTLLLYAAAHASLMEIGRKMYSKKEDTTDDSYSAQFGYKGVAASLVVASVISLAFSWYLLDYSNAVGMSLIIPVLILGLVIVSCVKYGLEPNKKNSQLVQGSAMFMYMGSMISVIIGVLG